MEFVNSWLRKLIKWIISMFLLKALTPDLILEDILKTLSC